MFSEIMDHLKGKKKIEGSVVLMKKNVLDLNDFNASMIDSVAEFLGSGVALQLVSSVLPDPVNKNKGKVGASANLEQWVNLFSPLAAGESKLKVHFEWDDHFGAPGAVIVKNNHSSEFFLKSITLSDVPHVGRVHFDCNSWVYPANKYKYDRIFFSNQTYLPSEMPPLLRPYREQELVNIRGTGKGELKEWDRVYDYAVYNDLGQPDKGPDYARQILGNSADFPYPRRGRTGRPPSKKDPNVESRLPLLSLDIYVPRDERFGHLKMSDFLGYALKSVVQVLLPELKAVFDKTPDEFDTFEDTYKLYDGGIKLMKLDFVRDFIPFEMIKELLRTDGEGLYKFPTPQVIQDSKTAWRTDEEFARETLAGVNPVIISLLKEFPPTSKLDPAKYGDQSSSIRAHHVEKSLDGMPLADALHNKKLFILNHHDTLMPYLRRINSTSTKTYASRTLLFLRADGTLKPVAIELSLPHENGDEHGAINRVFTPGESEVEHVVWQLAKAYAAVNDSGVHQLISHWLNTHAVIEPFVIATNRQLSVVHPVHKLLSPHYRDTMNINALARQILINAGGVLESTVFPRKYAMEMSAVVYKSWVFTEQGLPADLLKRGVAVEDPTQPSKVRLLIEDYPYAVDGLAIWTAIDSWVSEYLEIYYKTDESVAADTELQSWWKEVRYVGHGDKKDEPWWPAMTSVCDLASACTTLIWISSALHAAVNFGQYPYAGYLPNRPTVSRRFMPEPGTKEWAEMEKEPEKVFLKTITSQLQTVLGVSLIEILSRHSSDEVYLGRRASEEWTREVEAVKAFERFGERLVGIEERIVEMNGDGRFKNRFGPVKVPYTLLYPNTNNPDGASGLTGKGIPNSVSI
ncbi:putative linoleate 9S-lipoxygenase 5 [Acorus gramineus]|uniref:Lipoxygenase n=1 Tax=Acorus gramineus TaxID=55184 RepID=A0AAV9AS33_ACOGR|nr:putative linoleate 9S-lipoxygenase 5 [Acorus gramineus]